MSACTRVGGLPVGICLVRVGRGKGVCWRARVEDTPSEENGCLGATWGESNYLKGRSRICWGLVVSQVRQNRVESIGAGVVNGVGLVCSNENI